MSRICTNNLTRKSNESHIYGSKLAPYLYISCDQRDSSSRILLTWCKKKNNSGCQAAGIEASVSLRLLTHVILNVEFRLVRVVAFSGLQLPETRAADQLFNVYRFFCQSYGLVFIFDRVKKLSGRYFQARLKLSSDFRFFPVFKNVQFWKEITLIKLRSNETGYA